MANCLFRTLKIVNLTSEYCYRFKLSFFFFQIMEPRFYFQDEKMKSGKELTSHVFTSLSPFNSPMKNQVCEQATIAL